MTGTKVRPIDRSVTVSISGPEDLHQARSKISFKRLPSVTTQLLNEELAIRHPYRALISDDLHACNHYTFLHIPTLLIGLIFAPIRALVLIIAATMILITVKVISIGIPLPSLEDYQEKPSMSPFRRKLLHYLVRFWMRIILFACGIWWIQINGRKNYSKDAKIMGVGPHGTMLDGPVMMQIMDAPFTGIAAMAEGRRPFSGMFMRVLDYMFIDYKSTKSRKDCATGLVNRATSEDWAHLKMFLMCEGGTNNGTHLCQVKRGAFMPGVPIQPVVLEYPEWIDILKCNLTSDRTTLRGAGWASWGHELSIGWVALYTLCTPWQPVIVNVLPAYYPSEEEKNDTLLFSHNVRKEMEKQTRFKILRCNRLDGAICKYAHQKGLSIDNFIVFGEILEERYGTRVVLDEKLIELLDIFAKESDGGSHAEAEKLKIESKNPTGMVTFHEYCDHYFNQLKNANTV